MFTLSHKFKIVKTIPNDDIPKERDVYLNIVTTDKLLYYMVKDLTGDKHNVEYILDKEEDHWSFKYSEDCINNIEKKDIFIYSGSDFEPWVGDFIEKLKKSNVGIINASRGTKPIYLSEPRKYLNKDLKVNPYYWLSIDYYKISLSNIKNAIQEKDPKNRQFYEDNFSKKLKELDNYAEELKKSASKLEGYTFLVQGDELDYFTGYLGLKTIKFYNYGVNLQEDEKLNKKIEESKNVVFLYDDNMKLQKNAAFIKKYNLKTSAIIKHQSDLKYEDILQKNIDSLNKLSNQ